jgi:hypothetical protein
LYQNFSGNRLIPDTKAVVFEHVPRNNMGTSLGERRSRVALQDHQKSREKDYQKSRDG